MASKNKQSSPKRHAGRKTPGDPDTSILSDLERQSFLKLVLSGVGRDLACRRLGFDHAILLRTCRRDADFEAEVRHRERAYDDSARLVIRAAANDPSMLTDFAGAGGPEPLEGLTLDAINMRIKAAQAHLKDRYTVKAMNEARAARRAQAAVAERGLEIGAEALAQGKADLAKWQAEQVQRIREQEAGGSGPLTGPGEA